MNSWHIPGRYDFSIPEEQRLSDLSGIDVDLKAVLRICNRCEKLLNDLPQPTEANDLTWQDEVQSLGDLMFAAVVRYGRTLTSGARHGIPTEWISLLPKELQQSHAYFKALRDKYIAHSVNQLEDNQVFVILNPQFGERQKPAHITVDRGYLMTLGTPELNNLVALAKALQTRVSAEVESETARLLQIACGMPIEAIKARGTASVPVPGKAETFKVRKKF